MRNAAKVTLLIALTLTSFVVAQSDTLRLDAVLMESSDLLQGGDSEAALSLLKSHEADYSSSPQFLNNLAMAHLSNSDPISALTILRQLVDSDPIFGVVAHNLIELELRTTVTPTETINPILFVQSENSDDELDNTASAHMSEEAPSLLQYKGLNDQELVRIALREQILAWAEAWSSKQLEVYLEFYSSDYLPAGATSHREWRISRSVALNQPSETEVEISEIEIYIDGNTATASFEQNYRSGNYSDRVKKTLVYSYLDDNWKIVSETFRAIEE
jgi:ketosteroid isomerase-like protein